MVAQIVVLCDDNGHMNVSSAFNWRISCSGSWSINLGVSVIQREHSSGPNSTTVNFGMYRSESW